MTARSYLVLLSFALATYLGQSHALYTSTSGNETSLDVDSLSTREYYVVYGDTDSQLAGRELSSRNATLARRDVWTPKITSPNSKTVWVAGTTVTVTWDTSNPPEQITSTNGKLLLGHVDDGSDENLDIDHPLAEDFDLWEGRVRVTVPQVNPGNDYIVVLLGDSGNKSPTFTIN